MSKTEMITPILADILDREWEQLIKPLLMKRITLYLQQIEEIQKATKKEPMT